MSPRRRTPKPSADLQALATAAITYANAKAKADPMALDFHPDAQRDLDDALVTLKVFARAWVRSEGGTAG